MNDNDTKHPLVRPVFLGLLFACLALVAALYVVEYSCEALAYVESQS